MRHVVRWLCEAPAALAHLPSGAIEPGRRADIVAWNPEAGFTVHPDMLHQRHRFSPYLGQRLKGVVHHTWTAGKMVYADGQPVRTVRGEALQRH
jgi:allantoinase